MVDYNSLRLDSNQTVDTLTDCEIDTILNELNQESTEHDYDIDLELDANITVRTKLLEVRVTFEVNILFSIIVNNILVSNQSTNSFIYFSSMDLSIQNPGMVASSPNLLSDSAIPMFTSHAYY